MTSSTFQGWNKIAKGWNKILGMGNWGGGGSSDPPPPPGYGPDIRNLQLDLLQARHRRRHLVASRGFPVRAPWWQTEQLPAYNECPHITNFFLPPQFLRYRRTPIGVWAGGLGGCSPPPSFWATQFFGQRRSFFGAAAMVGGGCFSNFRRADDVTRTMSKGGGGCL